MIVAAMTPAKIQESAAPAVLAMESPLLSLVSGLSNSSQSQGFLPQCRAQMMAMSWVPRQLSSRQDLFPCLSGALVLICNVCLIYH